jgi:adenylate cyclase
MYAPNPADIQTELEHILSSKTFKKSTVLSNFLRYIVTETLQEKAHELKEYTIAVKGFGKPADFNPQFDAMIRINAGRLRRLLVEYYKEEGKDDPVNISMTSGSYVPAFSDRGKVKETVHETESDVSKKNRPLNTVAVLPFRNLSGSSENDFLIDGFCEQLSSDLGQFQEIKVIAYYSSSKFRETKLDIKQVGRELNTSHLITGSIYRDSTHLRVSIQLINAITGVQLWTQTYERDIQSSFVYDIFDDILKQIVPIFSGYYGLIVRSNSLSTQLDPSISQETMDAVFWFYHYEIRITEDIFQMAKMKIEKSLQVDPNYALAWALLAHLYVDSESLAYKTTGNPLEEADKCIERALQLDRNCQHAWLSLSWMQAYMREKNKAIKSLERCLSINPKASYFFAGACWMYAILSEYDKSMEFYQKAIELNPYCPWWLNMAPIFAQFHSGNYEGVLEYASRINLPGYFKVAIYRISALGHLGRMENMPEMINNFQMEFPGKARDACKIFKEMLFDESVADLIIEGLRKAGMPVDDSPPIQIPKKVRKVG